MVNTQSRASEAQMLNNRFQGPWEKAGRRCAERFVGQIVVLQGFTSPRRGTWRPGGSGGGWPFKIGVRPPLITRGPWEGRWSTVARPQAGAQPGGQAVEGVEFWCCSLDEWYVQEIMVNTQSHASEAQMLNN